MVALLGRFTKQPSEVLDYDVDFSEFINAGTDSPSAHAVVVEPGLTLVSSSRVGNVVKTVLSGGEPGAAYKVTVRLTTSTGLVKEADFRLSIKEV